MEDHVGSSEAEAEAGQEMEQRNEWGSATKLTIHHSADVYGLETVFHSGLSSNHIS